MHKLTTFLILATLFSLSSCKKETITTVEDDPALVQYFGSWEFTKTDYGDYWDYIPTPNGSQVVHTETETIVWKRSGTVSMGREMGELKIELGGGSSNYYYATVDAQGNLICSDNCETIPYVQTGAPGSGPSGHHQITDSTYSIDLGWSGGGSTVHSFDITGEKL